MEKTTIEIAGMHCRSCEILVEDELLKIPGINKAVVNQYKGVAELYHHEKLNIDRVGQAVCNAGYCLGKDEKPLISKNPRDYRDLAIAAFIVLDLYIIAKFFGIFNLNLAGSNNYSSLPIVLLIGITAGLSTCMALVGGLILGVSARFAEKHPAATAAQKFKPHLFFNLGRIVSFFILGGLIGLAGSFFQLSTTILGVLTIAVGAVMLLLGLQLTEISPATRKINFSLPKQISRFFGINDQNEKEYSNRGAAAMGAMTFFLPCGFTQAMQLFAISSGNVLTGALTMGVFAIGTAPGLLGIGGLTSVVKGTFGRLFFKTAGLVVVLLAFFNISNGYNLTGINPVGVLATMFSAGTASANLSDPNVTIENGVQLVRMTQDFSGYRPNTFTIKKGLPVRWIIDSKDPNSCASSIVMQAFGIRKNLQQGENILEFTPTQTGAVRFSCIMGMYTGVFNVVDLQSGVAPSIVQAAVQPLAPSGGGGCSKGGCGCGGGGKQNAPVIAPAPTVQGQTQILKAVYTADNDMVPNQFTFKAGTPARIEIDVKDDGYGCMGSVTIPGLTNKVELFRKGTPIVFDLNTAKAGRYPITCAMGVPRGEINVN